MMCATLIGFGEAGQAFAVGGDWRAFDIVPEKSRSASLTEALNGASAVLSVVTADQALTVAKQAAALIAPGTYFFDMNSVAPDTKRAAAAVIEACGGRYVDVAVMSPVNPARLATPLLVSGPYGEGGAAQLKQLGFTNVRVVGTHVGRASTIKMLRSVMYKGMEALTAECLMACERAGVIDEVLGSFGNDWASGADYRLDRMMVHGLRRSAEMEEVVKTLEALGVDPLMTRGTVDRQRAIGELGLSPVPEGLSAKLAVIPAKAGTQSLHKRSGEASKQRARLGPGLRRDDEEKAA
jgi:3-hydroxyisobutyrate dehydrogenase-like beta-hydroxyacid dehydrogenase